MQNAESNAGGPPREYPMLDALYGEFKAFLRSLEPSPEVCQHFRNARIEVLKGVRQMIDARIDYLNRKSQGAGKHIPVE
jgi:hypothetical protein